MGRLKPVADGPRTAACAGVPWPTRQRRQKTSLSLSLGGTRPKRKSWTLGRLIHNPALACINVFETLCVLTPKSRLIGGEPPTHTTTNVYRACLVLYCTSYLWAYRFDATNTL